MTRASKEARTRKRHREQVARLIAEVCFPVTAELSGSTWVAQCTIGQPEYEWVRFGSDDRGRAEHGALMGAVEDLLDGEIHFDVAKVREYGERLVALGEHFEVFADWTRERGLGPENSEHGAFGVSSVTCGNCGGHGMVNGYSNDVRDCPANCYRGTVRAPIVGGWPGPLARVYGWEECKACKAGCANCGSATRGACIAGDDGEWFCSAACADDHDERSCPLEVGRGEVQRRRRRLHGDRCPACKGRGLTRKPGIPPGFANGRALARMGRRLLAALERQPSECDACDGRGRAVIMSPAGRNDEGDCIACQGTGHNLGGVLPAVEWSPQLRRKLADMPQPVLPGRLDDWIGRLIEHGGQALLDARDTPLRTVVDPAIGGATAGLTVEQQSADPTRPLARLAFVERSLALPLWPPFGVPSVVRREETRVVPRGEHRGDIEPAVWVPRGSQQAHVLRLPGPVTRDGEQPVLVTARRLAPRWRRGELRHSEQRRELAERRRIRGRSPNVVIFDDMAFEAERPIGTVREVLDDGSVVVEIHR